MTPSGIEPATFRSVAQRLNHCATAVPQHFYHGHVFIRSFSFHRLLFTTWGNKRYGSLHTKGLIFTEDRVFEYTAVSTYRSYRQSITPSKLRVQSAAFQSSLSDRICVTEFITASDKTLHNNDYWDNDKQQ